MATSRGQRIGIAIILAVTVIGTLGSFAAMVLGSQTAAEDAKRQQKDLADYQAKAAERQDKIDAEGVNLSTKYFSTISRYSEKVASFDLSEANKELKFEDIVVGDGAEVTDDTKFAAYYIGWNPNGKIFDQSIDGSKLKMPIYYSDAATGMVGLEEGLKNATLIEGWKEGMKGMKVGGVREITIPSDKAYGEAGQGDAIPPNTPIKFIVLAIPALPDYPQPEYPASLLNGLY